MLDQVKTEAARTNLAPIPMECDAPFLKVTGELPRELNGTLYRNGPNPQFDAPGAHWFVGDGWLLSAVWRAQENRSDLAVFNAKDVEAGPVALVHLGHRVPDGFHGNWVGAN